MFFQSYISKEYYIVRIITLSSYNLNMKHTSEDDGAPKNQTLLLKEARIFLADLLEACQLRGAYSLEEVTGLLDYVTQMRQDVTKSECQDAKTDTWYEAVQSKVELAQERGKLSLGEAWSAYNALQLCAPSLTN